MAATKRSVDLEAFFKIEKTFLTFLTFYPLKNPKRRFLYFLIGCLNLLIGVVQFLSMVIQIIIDIKDVSKVSETIFFFITHSTYMCKLLNFLVYRKQLYDIEDSLAKPIFRRFSPKCVKIFNDKIGSTENVAIIFRIMCFISVALFSSMPYLDPNRKNSLILPGWQPYDARRFYYPTAFFQVVALCLTAINNVNFDTLFWVMTSLASAEFEMLKKNLENIDYSGGIWKVEDEFAQCVEHHKETVNFVYKIEETFSKGIFLTCLSSVVVICFTGFMLVIVPLGLQFAFLTMYFLSMMLEVAVYCWYGHDVMITSDKIGLSFYMSNWYESDLSLRKRILIFLERTKKPATLTGGKIVVLNMATFTSILRSSYSYFAVLMQLYNDS